MTYEYVQPNENQVFNPAVSKFNFGTISINMNQMDRWKVTSDNVEYYDRIMTLNGPFFTLDVRGYIEWLNEFGIFYTVKMG